MEKGRHGLTATATNSLNQGWRNSLRYSSPFGWPKLLAGRTSAAWSRGWGEEGKCLQAVKEAYVPENHSSLRKESMQASLKGEEKQVQLSQGLAVESERWLLCVLRLGSVTLSLKANPRVSTNLRPWGGSGKKISISFLPCLLKGCFSHERLPSYPPLPLGRSSSREIRKASSWAVPLLVQDVSADSLKGEFGFNNISEISVKMPWHFCNHDVSGSMAGNAFVNDCCSFKPCAALFDGLGMTPVLRCSGAADKVRCKEIHLWHKKSNSRAVCTWQIHGLSLFPRKPPKKYKQKSKCTVISWETNYLLEMHFQGADGLNVARML